MKKAREGLEFLAKACSPRFTWLSSAQASFCTDKSCREFHFLFCAFGSTELVNVTFVLVALTVLRLFRTSSSECILKIENICCYGYYVKLVGVIMANSKEPYDYIMYKISVESVERFEGCTHGLHDVTWRFGYACQECVSCV